MLKQQHSIFKVAAIQMVSCHDVSENLITAARLIEEAVEQGANLVVLPEFFAIMGVHEYDKVRAGELLGQGPIQSFLSRTAKQHQIWLIGGAIPLLAHTPDKVFNSCLVFDEQGNRVARYDKIHLFGFETAHESYNESHTIVPGNQIVVVQSPFGRIGLAICYDLRFPELFRAMKEIDLIVLPAAFTQTTGEVHWEVLLRARAVENLAYVIAAAQGGCHTNCRKTYGHSMIIDPWGKILNQLPKNEGVVVSEINLTYQSHLRASLPALAHRTLFVC